MRTRGLSRKAIERRQRVFEEYLKGKTAYQTAKETGLPQATVYRDYDSFREEEVELAAKETREQKRIELDRQLQGVISAAENHRETALSRRTNRRVKVSGRDRKELETPSPGGPKGKTELETEDLGPDIRSANDALAQKVAAIRERARIWGLATERREITGPEGKPIAGEFTFSDIVSKAREKAKSSESGGP